VQETLANIFRHARANSVRIATGCITHNHGERVFILIEDDGVGIDETTGGNGRGLNHMRARAEQLGAVIDIQSEPNRGTCVTLTLPLQAASI